MNLVGVGFNEFDSCPGLSITLLSIATKNGSHVIGEIKHFSRLVGRGIALASKQGLSFELRSQLGTSAGKILLDEVGTQGPIVIQIDLFLKNFAFLPYNLGDPVNSFKRALIGKIKSIPVHY